MFRAVRKQAIPLARCSPTASAATVRDGTTMAGEPKFIRNRGRRSAVGQARAKFSNVAMLNPAAVSQGTAPGAAAAAEQPSVAEKSGFKMPQLVEGPWHVFTPIGLSVVSTCGNLCGLAAAASHDHITMREYSVCAAGAVAAFNFLMPKPLKAHQWTAGTWGSAFCLLHLVNLGILLHEYDTGVSLTDEQEDIYEHGWQRFGVTPRQFANILHAGAEFKDYGPGEVLCEAGSPVNKVFYVVHGTCEGRHPETNTLRIEYHDDVFVGCMEPKAWQAEQSSKAGAAQDSMKDAKQKKKSRRDLRATLTSGLEEKTGPRTQLLVGQTWRNRGIAGPEGCRVLCWPLEEFAAAVGKDAKLVTAMEKLDEMSLACKICAGASRKALEGYKELLGSLISEGRVKPEDRSALARYRVRYTVQEADHLQMLEELGWTEKEFAEGFKGFA